MEDALELYQAGMSLHEVHEKTKIPISTLRGAFKRAGVLRTRAEGVRLAARKGRLGSGFRGKKRILSPEHRESISAARHEWADKYAVGVSLKQSGYLEYTRGPHKGRLVHVVTMETRLGRRLLPDECVHHIDENKANNSENNLALMTRSGHTRHHRILERMKKCQEV